MRNPNGPSIEEMEVWKDAQMDEEIISLKSALSAANGELRSRGQAIAQLNALLAEKETALATANETIVAQRLMLAQRAESIAELEKDKARLDWLVANTEFEFRTWSDELTRYVTKASAIGVVIREVIDASMTEWEIRPHTKLKNRVN